MAGRPVWGYLRWIGLAIAVTLGLFAGARLPDAARAAPAELASAVLAPLDASEFPTISAYLEVRDAQGNFVTDLQPAQVRVLEDGRPLPVQELELIQPGAQMVVALNPGRAFAIRDGQGISRYDRLVQALRNWASGQAAAAQEAQQHGGDDYSLLAPGKPEVLHRTDAGQWLDALEKYQPDLRSMDARLDVLLRAMEVADDPPLRPGMGRLILFITPPPEGDFSAGLQAIIARARQQQIHIYVWLVSSPEQFYSAGSAQLEELATQTGGTLFRYSGVEPVPNLEDLLRLNRYTYRLVYESRAAVSGSHQVVVEVRRAGFAQGEGAGEPTSTEVVTPPQMFEINILPPNPVFVEPPKEILRQSRNEGQAGALELWPEEQPLEVLVEFPDGFHRSVISMTLYVDGTPVDVRWEPPFNQVIWDLSPYSEDGGHTLRIEAVDVLGLRGVSREFPVRVTVKTTPRNILAALLRGGPTLAGVVAAFAAIVLILVLLLTGRIAPQPTVRGRQAGLGGRFRRGALADPLTQPVGGAGASRVSPESKTKPTARQAPAWMNRLQWPQRSAPSAAPLASLTRLIEVEGATLPSPISITTEEVVIGRDPSQVTLVLDDPSVEARHACLRLVEGNFRIADEGSTAGTWVNYTPVSREGVTLEHGDLVHIGRVGFRFLLRAPAHIRKPVVHRKD